MKEGGHAQKRLRWKISKTYLRCCACSQLLTSGQQRYDMEGYGRISLRAQRLEKTQVGWNNSGLVSNYTFYIHPMSIQQSSNESSWTSEVFSSLAGKPPRQSRAFPRLPLHPWLFNILVIISLQNCQGSKFEGDRQCQVYLILSFCGTHVPNLPMFLLYVQMPESVAKERSNGEQRRLLRAFTPASL